MTEGPKTPRTPSRVASRLRETAPKIQSPSAVALTPKTTRQSKKENIATANTRVKSTGRLRKVPTIDTPALPLIRAQTSREIAEVIAMLRAAKDMRVIEVPSGTVLDESEFIKLTSHNVPVVLRGYASGWDCVQNWCKPNYLKRAADEEAEELPHRKYRQFTARSAESGRLHLTDGKSKARPVSIREFLEHTTEQKTDDDGLYLLGIHAVGHHTPLSYCPVQRHSDDKERDPPLSRDVPPKVDLLEWYAKLLAKQQSVKDPIKYDHQQFFLAKGYAFTDLHYDSYDNFYVAVSGTRRWTLACPNASRWLIDSAGGKLKSGSTAIPHQHYFENGSPAQLYPFAYIDLAPGDVLYVPACWWHLVESKAGTDGFSSAFNFFFSKPADQVFGDFQARLSQTDAIVNALQSECRSNIAGACKLADEIDTSEKKQVHKQAPGGLKQAHWDQLIALMSVHNIKVEIDALYDKHQRNSIEVWSRPPSREPNAVTPIAG